jgi:hypothetical protein
MLLHIPVCNLTYKFTHTHTHSDDKSGYDQWVDRSYLQISTPSIDWDSWFDAINFTTVGLESEDENAPADDMGQPYDIPRLIVAKGDFPLTIEDILSCKVQSCTRSV